MRTHLFILSLFILPLNACLDSVDKTPVKSLDKSSPSQQVSLTTALNNLQFQQPVAAIQSTSKDWFVVEQGGNIYRLDRDAQNKTLFLDLSDKVKSQGEMGLLGFTLDPEFAENGIFFVSYTGYDNHSYISRFHTNKNGVDKTSEEILLKLSQPYRNHNGGQIAFGPDGYLYIGFGDGGSAGDPDDNAQNIETLLGAMLRIDVHKELPYTSPDDNPFINQPGKDEIFAYGLRNPWRWSFDKETGDLWVGDVGQNAWEEINIVTKGGNYGWKTMEGSHCFTVAECRPEDFIAPVFDYGRDEGQAITGGYVYRGENIPALVGKYIYGDFVSGKIWALSFDEKGTAINRLLLNSKKNISSFAEDQAGELYVIDYNGGIYAITAN